MYQPVKTNYNGDVNGDTAHLSVPSIQSPGASDEAIIKSDRSEEGERGEWGGKLEFVFSCISMAVGLGNIWRFPFLCFKNGGGAFLIPYLIMLVAIGVPMFVCEVAFGQFASQGATAIWSIVPLMKGVGFCAVTISFIICLYYNVVLAHVCFYLVASMTKVLPWTHCGHDWNTAHCVEQTYRSDQLASTPSPLLNVSFANVTVAGNTSYSLLTTAAALTNSSVPSYNTTPAEEYFNLFVLQKSSGIDDFGLPSWRLVLALFCAWASVCAILIGGVKTLGKVVYFTALFPYVMLAALLIRSLTLSGSLDGVIFFFKPDFSKLATSSIWSDAATQVFYSLGACNGQLISMSSFNKFSNNCIKDSVIVAVMDFFTSIFAGLVIFATLGFMAAEKGVNVEDVAAGGPGLAFVVYPEALSRMPIAPLWAVLFFFMMFILALGSQQGFVLTIFTVIFDEVKWLGRTEKRKVVTRVAACFIMFLLGIPMCCRGGLYLLNLIDNSMGGFPMLFVGLFEVITIFWIYGFQRFSDDVYMMIGQKPNVFWKATWLVISPVVLVVMVGFTVVQYTAPKLKETDGTEYVYPAWAEALWWLMAAFPSLMIPAWFIYYHFTHGGRELLRTLSAPLPRWGPRLKENRTGKYSAVKQNNCTVSDTFC